MRTDSITNESYGPACMDCGRALDDDESVQCFECYEEDQVILASFRVDALGRLVGPCPTCDGETEDTSGGPCGQCNAANQGFDVEREFIEWVHDRFVRLVKEEVCA